MKFKVKIFSILLIKVQMVSFNFRDSMAKSLGGMDSALNVFFFRLFTDR